MTRNPLVATPARVALVCLLSVQSALAAPSFQGLGFGPGATDSLRRVAVSADGSTVVGESGSQAVRWTAQGGIQALGFLPGGIYSSAIGISADGSVIVGVSDDANHQKQAFYWNKANGMQLLGNLPWATVPLSFANAVSADGSTVVGASTGSAGLQAFRWTASGGMRPLGVLPGGDTSSFAAAVSANGAVVVGYTQYDPGAEAFRWTQDNGIQTLGFLPPVPDTNSMATAVSADGTAIVGIASGRPFRWTNAGVTTLGPFPYPPEAEYTAAALAANNDASLIGGGFGDAGGSDEWAFLWDADYGFRNVQNLLVNQYGLDLSGWSLTSVTSLSADGLTIVGDGRHLGAPQAWIAVIPEPAALPLVTLFGAAVTRRRACYIRSSVGRD